MCLGDWSRQDLFTNEEFTALLFTEVAENNDDDIELDNDIFDNLNWFMYLM
jgi:hypothetical protein